MAASVSSSHFQDEFEEFKARACNGGTPMRLWYAGAEGRDIQPPRVPHARPRSHSLAPALECRKKHSERMGLLCSPLKEMALSENQSTESLTRSPILGKVSGQRRCTIATCVRQPEMDLLKLPEWPETLYRRRSFSTSAKGIVNEGDSLVLKKFDSGSNTNLTIEFPLDSETRSRASSFNSGSVYSASSSQELNVHKVLMLGSSGVGKTSLTQQFMTSEYMGAQNLSFDTDGICHVSILLDGEEASLEFMDDTHNQTFSIDDPLAPDRIQDAYVVVYSITSRHSFQRAEAMLERLREVSPLVAIILVGNKSDLARSRLVREDEGRTLAEKNDCKFIEVSAALNHRVDELLVGVLKQIRLTAERAQHQKRRKSRGCLESGAESNCIQKARQNVLRKLFGSNRGMSKSCENLLTL